MHVDPGERGFIRSVTLLRDRVPGFDAYPFSIPAVRHLETLALDPAVTFVVGENGSGKSTLVEAIAVAAGLNAEGGTTGFNFATRGSHSELHDALRLTRGAARPQMAFFLRAESFFNVATQVDELDVVRHYGGRSLHEQSHGESFLAVVNNRFEANGLYILDEPESALSVPGCLALLRRMHELAGEGSQFIVATHSPILMGYPGALIHALSEDGFERVAWEETEHYTLTRSFLESPERFFRHLFD